jgi:hypothetical protein
MLIRIAVKASGFAMVATSREMAVNYRRSAMSPWRAIFGPAKGIVA